MTSDGPTELPDWAVSQREHLEASVVGRFGVHPPWCEPVGRIQFSIDPGPTFGHGGHPSTVLVLAEIDRIEPEGLSVLDVGCGSGVLAIAAALVGADPVVAIDVDPDAVAWAQFNAAANDATVDASATPIADLEGPFDLVVVNVLPSEHESVAKDVARLTSGRLVVRVSAPPVEGKANSELLKFLASSLECSQRDVNLRTGLRSREKRVQIKAPFQIPEILSGSLKHD